MSHKISLWLLTFIPNKNCHPGMLTLCVSDKLGFEVSFYLQNFKAEIFILIELILWDFILVVDITHMWKNISFIQHGQTSSLHFSDRKWEEKFPPRLGCEV